MRTPFRGQVRYIISDAARGRHVSLAPEGYRLLTALQTPATVAQLSTRLAMPPEWVSALLSRLVIAGLVRPDGAETPAPAPPAGPVEGRALFLKRELVELMPLMPLADRLLGRLFTPAGALLWALLAVAALMLVAADDSRLDPFGWIRQFDAGEAILLYGIFLLLKALHELGHALALWRMAAREGLPLHSIRAGIAAMLFIPFPFTNVSTAWGLGSKWRRALVGMAGMYVESWVAILAILVWALSDNPLVEAGAIQVATVAAVTTLLFNLNPFGRMDGYYVLADLLERPNLMQRAQQAAMAVPMRLFAARPVTKLPPLEPALLLYWLGTLAYRLLVFAGLVWLAHGVSPLASILMLLIAVSLLVVRPLIATARLLLSQAEDRSAMQRRLTVAGAAGFALVALLPFPAGVVAAGIVEVPGARFVFPSRDVRVASVAPAGSSGGQLQLVAPDLALEQRQVALREAEAMSRWRLASETGDVSAQAAAESAAGLQDTAVALADEAAGLEVRDAAGWDPLDSEAYRGAFVPGGRRQPLAVALPTGALRIHAVVPERDAAALRSGTPTARVRVAGRPELAFYAQLLRISAEAGHQIPAEALGKPAGGPIALDVGDGSGMRSAAPLVSVWLEPSEEAPTLRHGQRVEVRIGTPPRPLLWQGVVWALGLLDQDAARA
jgi:putative peptide zinc metalloprotease protein